MYNDFYNTTPVNTGIDSTWIIVSAILAIVGGITIYCLFVAKKKKSDYNPYVVWLHDFLNFKKYFINAILKVMYIMCTIFITLGSFAFIGSSVATFFLTLILGNIAVRISYELILMLITIVNNTNEINEKLNVQKRDIEKESIKPKKKIEEEKK